MSQVSDKNGPEQRKTEKNGPPNLSTAEDMFARAMEHHQRGELFEAESLCVQVVKQFPGSPKSELAKTFIAGMQKEKAGILWDTAWEARSQCNVSQAVKLYQKIIDENPDSSEAKSARTEIQNVNEIQRSWNAALEVQSQSDEIKALQLYQQIVELHPNSPEAENAGLLMAIIHQNQLMPRGEVSQDFKFEKITPESLVSHLHAHKKAASGAVRQHPEEGAKAEDLDKKIDILWTQAKSLEKDGNSNEAVMLYQKIIDTSANGHRVRDARYRVEKIKETAGNLMRSYEKPDQWGLAQDRGNPIAQMLRSKKFLASLVAVIGVIAVVILAYRATRPPSWADVMENAKKSIVVVKTATGAGTGFLISQNGDIITNAQVIGKEKAVEVRLYSGILKKAEVVKVGTKLLDVALLKIDGLYDTNLPLSGTDECQEGMEIRVLGAPSGVEYFMTKGMISHCSLDRDGVRYIQTDTAISAGGSGGPCLNQRGKVIGLSTPILLNNDVKSLNIILPQTVIKDFMEGKLTALEESLIKKEEEKAKEQEENKKQLYISIENINARLQLVASSERTAYLKKVSDLLNRRQITSQQADMMVEQINYGPSWSVSMTQWVQSLALKVAKGDISDESAVMLIKNQHKVQ
ncbi:MAG: trypsin-like peptidase domain-containing protein [Nitrospirota bacterium]